MASSLSLFLGWSWALDWCTRSGQSLLHDLGEAGRMPLELSWQDMPWQYCNQPTARSGYWNGFSFMVSPYHNWFVIVPWTVNQKEAKKPGRNPQSSTRVTSEFNHPSALPLWLATAWRYDWDLSKLRVLLRHAVFFFTGCYDSSAPKNYGTTSSKHPTYGSTNGFLPFVNQA